MHLSFSHNGLHCYITQFFPKFFLSLLHNFIQQSLYPGSAQVQILLVACRRLRCWESLTVVLAGNNPLTLNAFHRSTIPQKQFIIIIIITIIIFIIIITIKGEYFLSYLGWNNENKLNRVGGILHTTTNKWTYQQCLSSVQVIDIFIFLFTQRYLFMMK